MKVNVPGAAFRAGGVDDLMKIKYPKAGRKNPPPWGGRVLYPSEGKPQPTDTGIQKPPSWVKRTPHHNPPAPTMAQTPPLPGRAPPPPPSHCQTTNSGPYTQLLCRPPMHIAASPSPPPPQPPFPVSNPSFFSPPKQVFVHSRVVKPLPNLFKCREHKLTCSLRPSSTLFFFCFFCKNMSNLKAAVSSGGQPNIH